MWALVTRLLEKKYTNDNAKTLILFFKVILEFNLILINFTCFYFRSIIEFSIAIVHFFSFQRTKIIYNPFYNTTISYGRVFVSITQFLGKGLKFEPQTPYLFTLKKDEPLNYLGKKKKYMEGSRKQQPCSFC